MRFLALLLLASCTDLAPHINDGHCIQFDCKSDVTDAIGVSDTFKYTFYVYGGIDSATVVNNIDRSLDFSNETTPFLNIKGDVFFMDEDLGNINNDLDFLLKSTPRDTGNTTVIVLPDDPNSGLRGFVPLPRNAETISLVAPYFDISFLGYSGLDSECMEDCSNHIGCHEWVGHQNGLDHNFAKCNNVMSYNCTANHFVDSEIEFMKKWSAKYRSHIKNPLK